MAALIELLKHSDAELAACAAAGLSRTLLVYDAFNEVMDLAESNHLPSRWSSWAPPSGSPPDRTGRQHHRDGVQG